MSPLAESRNIAARMGRWSASHKKTAIFGWLAFVLAAFVIGNVVSVAVTDDRTGTDFELAVPADRARDAFHHPYAYAAGSGLLTEVESFEPIAA